MLTIVEDCICKKNQIQLKIAAFSVEKLQLFCDDFQIPSCSSSDWAAQV